MMFEEKPKGSETIAHLIFEYNGKRYPLDYSFGNDYNMGSALFMFNDGNYACDDNRSMFLNEKYPKVPRIDECGNTIKLVEQNYEGPAPDKWERCCHCHGIVAPFDEDAATDCGKPAHLRCIIGTFQST